MFAGHVTALHVKGKIDAFRRHRCGRRPSDEEEVLSVCSFLCSCPFAAMKSSSILAVLPTHAPKKTGGHGQRVCFFLFPARSQLDMPVSGSGLSFVTSGGMSDASGCWCFTAASVFLALRCSVLSTSAED